jgi:hypothetical protein
MDAAGTTFSLTDIRHRADKQRQVRFAVDEQTER